MHYREDIFVIAFTRRDSQRRSNIFLSYATVANGNVELIGQFMPDTSNNAGGNRFKAVRMFMVCCAADSRPVATLVEADKLPDFPEMTWVKITGTPTFPIEKGRRISVLKAAKVEKTKPPEEAMIY